MLTLTPRIIAAGSRCKKMMCITSQQLAEQLGRSELGALQFADVRRRRRVMLAVLLAGLLACESVSRARSKLTYSSRID